jgi:hypothetical protein
MITGTLTPGGLVNAKEVDQKKMTSECWGVQMWGTDYCKSCEFKGKRDCGGKNILKTGKNAAGCAVNEKGLV